jgi:hypothetical protein
MTDGQLMDWIEAKVIAVSAHPMGWEFRLAGVDGEPLTQDAKLFEGDDFRDVCRAAKDWQGEACAVEEETLS